MAELPIHDVLPNLLAALRSGSNAVLVAPPGAGKTTALHELEDIGWEAVDNFPIRLLGRLINREGERAIPTIGTYRRNAQGPTTYVFTPAT